MYLCFREFLKLLPEIFNNLVWGSNNLKRDFDTFLNQYHYGVYNENSMMNYHLKFEKH